MPTLQRSFGSDYINQGPLVCTGDLRFLQSDSVPTLQMSFDETINGGLLVCIGDPGFFRDKFCADSAEVPWMRQ